MPHINLRAPCYFAKVPDGPQTYTLNALWLQGGAQIRMCEWSRSFTLTMWAEVSSFAPHLLHSGLSSSPSKWRCLLSLLRPVRKPVTALDWALFKDRNLALAPRQGPEISSRACLRVSPRPRHRTQCWLANRWQILLRISCLGRYRLKRRHFRGSVVVELKIMGCIKCRTVCTAGSIYFSR